MRVLYINTEGEIAGGEKSLLLSLDLLRKQCEMIFACPFGRLSRAVDSRGILWKRLPASPRSKWFSFLGLVHAIKLSLVLLRVLVRYKPDIVHANNVVAASVAWLPCFMTRTKFILHVRDVPGRPLIYRFIGSKAACVIAVSEFIRLSLVKIGIAGHNVFVIHNPIEGLAAEEGKIIVRETKKSGYVYANIGQLIPWKRQDVFIEASEIVMQSQPDAFFWIVGDDIFGRNSSYREFILKMIENSPLKNRLVFKGWQEDMASLWKEIDCLVHTADKEPFGRIVIEAMQLGVPIVASNAGGPAELLNDGETGYLVDHNEPAGFAAVMSEAFGNGRKNFKMSDNAKRYAIENFSQSAISDAILDTYRRVLAK